MSGGRGRAAAGEPLRHDSIFTHKLLGDIQPYDDNKRRCYVKLADAMRRAKNDASMIDDARAFVRKFMLSNPRQRAYGERWMEVLDLPVDEIARLLLADTPEGDLLRDTAPVFGKGLSAQEARDLLYGSGAA